MFNLLPVSTLLTACGADKTLTGYADPSAVYVLQSIDGLPVTARATLRLDQPGQISGDAPCNSYNATQDAPYQRFEAGPIRSTRRACPDLAVEAALFAALADMTLSEVGGAVVILSHTDGRELVFQAE